MCLYSHSPHPIPILHAHGHQPPLLSEMVVDVMDALNSTAAASAFASELLPALVVVVRDCCACEELM
jgi:hypothetical protein